jgi:prepilin-type N-terminal cleavage/methylation domain-containing protein
MTHGNERGVTLVELMVAMMLLAVALAGLAASYPLAMQAVTAGGLKTTATLLAQQCIELAKSLPYDSLPGGLASSCPARPPGYPGFARSVTVTPATPTPTTTTVAVAVAAPGAAADPGPIQTTVTTVLAQ